MTDFLNLGGIAENENGQTETTVGRLFFKHGIGANAHDCGHLGRRRRDKLPARKLESREEQDTSHARNSYGEGFGTGRRPDQ